MSAPFMGFAYMGVSLVQDRPLPWGWKDVPILFRTDMVQRIKAKEKTETRRVTRLHRVNRHPDVWKLEGLHDVPKKGVIAYFLRPTDNRRLAVKCPYGSPGDRLWVRETWGEDDAFCEGIQYYADCPQEEHDRADRAGWKWRPSIHMPRTAARLFLRVIEIRVERLSRLTEEGAIAEGIKKFEFPDDHGYALPGKSILYPSARDYFLHRLWDKIHADDGLTCAANPWVWVVVFEPTDGAPAAAGEKGLQRCDVVVSSRRLGKRTRAKSKTGGKHA